MKKQEYICEDYDGNIFLSFDKGKEPIAVIDAKLIDYYADEIMNGAQIL